VTASTHLVGLDLGTSGVRGVEARLHKGRYTIIRAAQVDLPEDCILNGAILEPDPVVKALRALWRRGRFTTRKVALAITDTSVITRQLDLPWMPPEDFRTALRYQVADALPVDLSSVQLDFHPLNEYQITDQHGQIVDMQQFLLVAANNDALTSVAKVLLRARLEPVVADTAAFALIRAACSGVLSSDTALQGVIDIGADALTVAIHQGGQPRFIRAMPNQGGDIVMLTLKTAMGLTTTEATDLMWRTGLNGPPPVVTPVAESSVFGALATSAEATSDPMAKRALTLINPWATTLVGAIRDSLDYFAATGRKEQVSQLLLTGRTSHLPGLAERIATELRIPVTHLDPFAGPETSHRVRRIDSQSLCVATGLAMGG
jgi:type IV pilus assembly protein PilM